MVSVETTGTVNRSASAVFEYATDHRNMTEWVFGITSVDSVGDVDRGPGAIYEGAVDLGPKTLRSKARIDAWEPNRSVTLTAMDGFDFSLTLRLTSEQEGQTRLDFELEFGTTGGATSRALSKTLEPVIGLAARLTTDKLCKAVVAATTPGEQPQDVNSSSTEAGEQP